MSFKAIIEFEGEKYNVLDFNIDLKKNADYSGRPTTDFRGGYLMAIVEGDERSTIYELTIDPTRMVQKVKLTIFPTHLNGKSKIYEFIDCYFLESTDQFSMHTDTAYQIQFFMSPAQLLENGVLKFQKSWKVTDVSRLGKNFKEEGRVVDYYMTNTDQERIENYAIGETIILNIETKGLKGEKLDLSLNDPDFDFEHEGNVLPNDTLKNLSITDDMMQIELKVIELQNQNI